MTTTYERRQRLINELTAMQITMEEIGATVRNNPKMAGLVADVEAVESAIRRTMVEVEVG